MRVLILSCNTGEGHNSCSEAIREAFMASNIDCETEDALSFVSPAFSRFVSWGHSLMYRYIPGLFGSGYQYAERHTGIFSEKAGVYKMLTTGTKRLYQFLQTGGYDTVVCPHVFSEIMLTDVMRKFHPKIRTCFVATDYTCSPNCRASTLDAYFIPDSSLKEEFVSCGVPIEKLIASGIPVRQEFLHHTSMADAKKSMGIPEDCRHLLVMCGSMGCGPIRKLVRLLGEALPENGHITVICGTNRKLQKKLEWEHAANCHIHISGFRKDISTVMDSADLYLTKPGGISSTEASIKKLPMVFVNAVAGCESYNMQFFIKQGCAATADTPEEIASLTLSLLSNAEKLREMSSAFDKQHALSSADIICDYFLEQPPKYL